LRVAKKALVWVVLLARVLVDVMVVLKAALKAVPSAYVLVAS